MTEELNLKLLGKPEILLGGQPVVIFHKAQALFYYLAVTEHAHERSALLELLWSKIEGSDAKNNLRVTLSHLRKQGLGGHLSINRHSVAFDTNSNHFLDVEVLKSALRATPKTTDYLEKTLKLYRGPFLEGFQVPEEKVFEQWVKKERQHIHNLVVQTLFTLALRYQEQRNYSASIDAINRLLALQPYHEDALQTLMVLLERTGQHSEAVAQYNLYAQHLKQQQQSTPSLEEILAEHASRTTKIARTLERAAQYETLPGPVLDYGELENFEQRRQVTLMYCYLQETAVERDPELWHNQRQACMEFCIKVIRELRGEVVQQDNHGLLVTFGCPRTYEDSGYWAVQAGLSILRAFESSPQMSVHQLAIGIHTGVAVVETVKSESGEPETKIIGPPTSVVEQLARRAKPDTLFISEATHQIIEGYFLCQKHTDMGDEIVYQVTGESGVTNHLEVVQSISGERLTPFVDREAELKALTAKWQEAQKDAGKVVLVYGEMGIGKSRLMSQMMQQIQSSQKKVSADKQPIMLRAQCSAFYQGEPLYPFLKLLEGWWACTPQDQLTKLFDKLIDNLSKDERFSEVKNLKDFIRSLVGLPRNAEPEDELEMTPSHQETAHLLLAMFAQLSKQRPILLIVEDLQWADAESLMLLSLLLEQQEQSRQLMVVLTARPEFNPTWPHYAHISSFRLPRLSMKNTSTLIDNVLQKYKLPDALYDDILNQSDGIPLFAESLAKRAMRLSKETPDLSLEGETLFPPALYDLLMMPLDSLGQAKQIAQLGAVLGREFHYETLRMLWPEDEARLQKGLQRLVDMGIVFPRGQIPRVSYKFNYALTQAVAYHSLLKRQLQDILSQKEKVSDQMSK